MVAIDTSTRLTDDWQVSGRIYHDASLFEAEQEKIFRTTWLYVAHESQLKEPGDYVTTFAGTQPVIVSRDGDTREISVMLNRCRHRGATVCQALAGNSSFFRCAYHGWTYENNGKLRGITYDAGYPNIDRDSLGLVRMPRIDTHAGFIFASFAAQGPTLLEHLGHAAPYLEWISTMGPQGVRLNAGMHRLDIDINWKIQLENTIDNYHFGFVHRSFVDVLADRLGAAPPIIKNILTNPAWRTIDLGGGHSVHEFGSPDEGNNQAQIGDLPFNLIVFPNLAFVGAQLRHVLPKSVGKSEVRLFPILHEGASDEHNAAILRAHEGFYGPAGMGSGDDVEIAFDRVADGIKATELDWLYLSRGLENEQPTGDGRIVGHSADEVPQRAFYRQWFKTMGKGA
jgi:phenylpropionate dioxygenase-like ring-hydroxylating dioxygenase large terminal subunit